MTTRWSVSKSKRAASLVAAGLVLGSAAAGAQEAQTASTDARWTAWVGCWQASSRDAESQNLAPNKAFPVVCVVPAAGNATIDLLTVTGGTSVTTERVDANGSRRAVNREGCNGWETAEFSADAKRIYLRSEHQCTGNRTRTSSGIMSISPNGEWLDVQGIKVDTRNGVRVVHYGRVPTPAVLSAEMKAALEGTTMARSVAVLAASDSVKIPEVIEASKRVDPLVVQTWLAQRGQGFGIDAKRLSQLADAKVPGNVIDVMVALSYPQAFAINLAQADGQIVQTSGTAQVTEEESFRNGPTLFMDWDPLYSQYGYDYYSRYGYRSGLGYGGFYPNYWYRGTPIIVTRPHNSVGADVPADTRGRMVRGRGYTRPSDRSDGGSSGSATGSRSGGSGSSSAGSSGGSSSGGGGEKRTAKPRSP